MCTSCCQNKIKMLLNIGIYRLEKFCQGPSKISLDHANICFTGVRGGVSMYITYIKTLFANMSAFQGHEAFMRILVCASPEHVNTCLRA